MPPVSPDESRRLRNAALTQRDAWCQLTTPDGPPYGRLPVERKALRSIPASEVPISNRTGRHPRGGGLVEVIRRAYVCDLPVIIAGRSLKRVAVTVDVVPGT